MYEFPIIPYYYYRKLITYINTMTQTNTPSCESY